MATPTLSFLVSGGVEGRSTALDDAVRSMVTYTHLQGRFRVTLPVVMATGSSSTVTVWPEGGGNTFMVSDDGAAFMEVLSGAFSETVFRRLAREKCERYGAAFDGGTMLYLRVSKDKLRGAIVAMANLMREVVDDTIHRSVDSRVHQIDQELWHKLDAAFGAGSVERKVQLSGESTAVHEFKALVKTEKGYVAFDTFSSQGHSVNSIYVKMSDLNRRHDAPRGVAVTRDLGSVGPKLHLISSVARVVEIGIGPELFHRLAEAA